MYAGGKARRCHRSRQEIAVMDRQPDIFSVADIEIGVRYAKGFRLSGGGNRQTLEIIGGLLLRGGGADLSAQPPVLAVLPARPTVAAPPAGFASFLFPPPIRHH